MFNKNASVSDQILADMVKNLKNNDLNTAFKQNNLNIAASHISNAAELFEKLNMSKEAKTLTNFLTKLANHTPEDYEACGECGFDHSYEPSEALDFHTKYNSDNDENVFEEELNKEELPSDYETCAHCGFDHEYEYAEAKNYHTKHPSAEDNGF